MEEIDDIKDFTENFFQSDDSIKILTYILVSSIFSVLIVPFVFVMGYTVNVMSYAPDDDLMSRLEQKDPKQILKEGFYFTLMLLLISLFFFLLYLIGVFVLGGGQLIYPNAGAETYFSFLVLTFLSIITGYVLSSALLLVYSRERDFSKTFSYKRMNHVMSKKQFYINIGIALLVNIIITVITFFLPFLGVLSPIINTYMFGIIGLTLPSKRLKEESNN